MDEVGGQTRLMTNRVYIFDTTLRDGEQSPGCSMTVPEKVRLAGKLADLGVDTMEAGFPIASEGDFEAVRAVSREFPWVQVAALARSSTGDVERAAKSLELAKRPRIHTFLATSDIHLKYKLKKSREEILEIAVAAVELARKYVDDVEFSAEDGARTDPDYLERAQSTFLTQWVIPCRMNTPPSSGAWCGRWAIRPW
jgi:2-isopropylmalate synthase